MRGAARRAKQLMLELALFFTIATVTNDLAGLEFKCAKFCFLEQFQQLCALTRAATKISLYVNQKPCIMRPSRPTRRGVRVVTTRDEDAMDASGARRRHAALRTAKACGPVPPTLGSTSGSKARRDGG